MHRALIQHTSTEQAQQALETVLERFAGRVNAGLWPPDILLLSGQDGQVLREAVEEVEGSRLWPVQYFSA